MARAKIAQRKTPEKARTEKDRSSKRSPKKRGQGRWAPKGPRVRPLVAKKPRARASSKLVKACQGLSRNAHLGPICIRSDMHKISSYEVRGRESVDHNRPAAANFRTAGRWWCIFSRPLGAGKVYTTNALRPQSLRPPCGGAVYISQPRRMAVIWPRSTISFLMLRKTASGPEIVLRGWSSAGFESGTPQNRPPGLPKAGRRADSEVFPIRIRPKSGPEDLAPARKHLKHRPYGLPKAGRRTELRPGSTI
jgi:hypothetical protein